MEIQLDADKKWGLVAYTDGGARPNPGPAGMGMHAYLYPIGEDPSKAKPIKFTDVDVVKYAITTDKGYVYCSKTGEVSSAADKTSVLVAPTLYAVLAESSSNQHTNNYAEVKSLLNALRLAQTHQVQDICIITDSEYARKGALMWCDAWAANGWVNRFQEPVKNKELWQVVHKCLLDLRARGANLTINWIKGHKAHPGNYHADALATVGVIKSTRGVDDDTLHVFTPKQWWEPKRDRHPLLSLKRMYFNGAKEFNDPSLYLMADPGKEDHLIGKPLSDTVFALVRMNQPDPIIEAIQNAQFRYDQEFNNTMMIRMENAYTPEAYNLIKTFGEHAMLRADRSCAVELPENRPMTQVRAPIGITMRAIDALNSLESILDTYQAKLAANSEEVFDNKDLQFFDITDEFYDTVEKKVGSETVNKRVLKKEMGVGLKTVGISREIMIEGKPKLFTIPLKLGLDTLTRNDLKTLETSDPIVHLVTWRPSSTAVRYATVIRCNEGYAMWSNFYADCILLKKENA